MFNVNEQISELKAKNMNPVVLAFIGDAVYSLYVREKLAFNTDFKSGELNKRSSEIVRASAQASFIDKILPLLTPEEEDVYRRARNAKKGTRAKSSTVAEYNKSTGFEALVGYLYITGKTDRLNVLLNYEENSNEN